MMQVKLKGSPRTQWMIDGHFINGQTIVEFTDEQVKKYKDVIEGEIEEKKEIKKTKKTKKTKKVAK